MKITDAKVFVGGPGKNYVTLKIMTDQGIYGLGDATLKNRETLPAAYLSDYIVPNLIGMDPCRSEDIWQFFYRGAYFRRGPITMSAIGAVDMALWDIKGKLANMPLYQLFGGKSRDGAMVYAHATGSDLEDLMDTVSHYVALGYKAVRVQCGIPAMPSASYAVPEKKGAGKHYITDFGGIRPKVETWDTGRYMRYMPGDLAEIRARFGPDLHILHDVHHRLLPREAAAFAKAVEPVGLYWLEDPTPAEDQDALRLIRQHSTTPIRHRRSLQRDLGLQQADRERADRLHPRLGDQRRRPYAHETHRRSRSAAPCAHRVPRRAEPFSALHGGAGASQRLGAQFRYPGIPGAGHGRMRRAVPLRPPDGKRAHACERRARSRSRLRRGRSPALQLQTGKPPGRQAGRRHAVELLTRQRRAPRYVLTSAHHTLCDTHRCAAA